MTPSRSALLCGFAILLLAGGGYAYWRGAPDRGTVNCLELHKKMAAALLLYANQHDDQLPHRDNWMTATGSAQFRCPELHEGPYPHGFAFNSNLSTVRISTVAEPSKTVLTYDSINYAIDAGDPLLSLPEDPRHKHGNPGSYLDGHVAIIPESVGKEARAKLPQFEVGSALKP